MKSKEQRACERHAAPPDGGVKWVTLLRAAGKESPGGFGVDVVVVFSETLVRRQGEAAILTCTRSHAEREPRNGALCILKAREDWYITEAAAVKE